MSTNTGIEWTDATWNPIRGCSRVSEGCRNCYAERQAARQIHGTYEGLVRIHPTPACPPDSARREPRWTGEVRFVEKNLLDPLKWRKPRLVFVNSMSDLFHEKVPDEWIDRIFAVMYAAHWHRFQILTKRPRRMLEYCAPARIESIADEALAQYSHYDRWAKDESLLTARDIAEDIQWPLQNVWLGVSVEDQKTADERIPLLLQTPAAVRWVSYEPALGPVDFSDYFPTRCCNGTDCGCRGLPINPPPYCDWIVAGGESGARARPAHPDWFRSARDQCQAAGVPFFFKQWGEWGSQGFSRQATIIEPSGKTREFSSEFNIAKGDRMTYRVGKKAAGRLLDGRVHSEYPLEVCTAVSA